jgi:hypothetical protein
MNWVIQHDFIMNPEYQIYKNVASQNCRKKGVHLVSGNVSGSSESYIIIGSSPTRPVQTDRPTKEYAYYK